jgi:hypothetical protein
VTRDVAPDVDGAVSRDARNPEASALRRRHILREWSNMIQRDYGKLRGSAEWAIGLCAVTPDATADPFLRYAIPDLIHLPGPVAMRNNPGVWHAYSK